MLRNIIASLIADARTRRRLTANRSLDDVLDKGRALERAGDYDGAQRCYERVLECDPSHAAAHQLWGALLGRLGEYDAAATHLELALASRPNFPDAYLALGNIRLLQGNTSDARRAYDAAIACEPNSSAGHRNLGLLLQRTGEPDAAVRAYERAYALAEDRNELLPELIGAYLQLEQFEPALELLRQAEREQLPTYESLKCLGLTLHGMHRPEEAIAYYNKAIALKDREIELLVELGVAHRDLGQLDEALRWFDAALALDSHAVLAHWHRALVLLLRHDFERGWDEYDLRLQSADLIERPQRYPAWTGGALAGRKLLVYGEQGIGDEIMFASCLPELIAAGAHCVIECSAKLERLFRRAFPRAVVYAALPNKSVPESIRAAGIDCEIALGSIPRYTRGSAAAFRDHQGYLSADPARIARWRTELARLGPGLRVGISWQGGSQRSRQPVRSLALAQWPPILRVPGVHFIDLQYTDATVEIAQLREATGLQVHHWQAVQDDYEDTAAMVCALDLVISVCTAVIHLAGALGRPVWVMAPFSPEWRYGIAGERMPWYPTARVIRQPRYGEWQPVIDEVAQRLRALTLETSV